MARYGEIIYVSCLLLTAYRIFCIVYSIGNTVNSLVSDHPWGITKWSLTGQDKQNKPNTGLINILHKKLTLAAKIRQIETNLFDFFFFTSKFFWWNFV